MYRTDLSSRDKGGAIAAVLAIHAALAFALLQMSGQIDMGDPEDALRVFDITEVIPPPPPPPPPQQAQQPKPKDEEGGSPANIKSEATPVVAPKPRIELPVKPPIAVTETPRQGAAPTQGAAAVRGPGTGAGGAGTGSGSGSGAGAGGGGGVATRPTIIRGIEGRDYPPQIQRRWPRGGAIFLRLRIEPSGRPSQCDVMRSFGDPVADQWTCNLIMQRGIFRPATNVRGQPVAAWYGYVQRERDR
jgi:periplasmic protein TonB